MFQDIYLSCKVSDVEDCPLNNWEDLTEETQQELLKLHNDGFVDYDSMDDIYETTELQELYCGREQFQLIRFKNYFILINTEGYDYPRYSGVLLNTSF